MSAVGEGAGARRVMAEPEGPGLVEVGRRLRWFLADSETMARRNVIALTRVPASVFFATVQPIMFVLLFRYVFGGAIPTRETGGLHYVAYLMPGIFVQAMGFGSISTCVGLAEDIQKGLLERFRALPMARSAVLTGRTSADLLRNLIVVVVITFVGMAVGFRLQTGLPRFIAGAAIVVAFAYALSWGMACLGLIAPNSETAQVMAFPILFPLTFASTAFVPAQTMPSWLQGFVRHQPVSVVVNAARALMLGRPGELIAGASTGTLVWEALVWCSGLLLVLAPLAVSLYRRRV